MGAPEPQEADREDPCGRTTIITIITAPKMSIRAEAKPRNSSGSPTTNAAPTTTPGMEPEPPRITMRKTTTDSQEPKDSGETMVILAA